MRHARAEDLEPIQPLLIELRASAQLVERSPGVFYRRGRAFLHFHSDPSGLHADVRVREDFERFRVETAEERRSLLEIVSGTLRPA